MPLLMSAAVVAFEAMLLFFITLFLLGELLSSV